MKRRWRFNANIEDKNAVALGFGLFSCGCAHVFWQVGVALESHCVFCWLYIQWMQCHVVTSFELGCNRGSCYDIQKLVFKSLTWLQTCGEGCYTFFGVESDLVEE